jgi:hypothetical protein
MNRLTRTVIAAAAGAGLVLAPLAVASSAQAAPTKPKPRFVVSALTLLGPASVDVSAAPATLKARVQVKDFSKKFDPATVRLVVVEKSGGAIVDTMTVKARKAGRSAVVSNWLARITIPQGSAPATYCIALVKVDDASPATLPVLKLAKGLQGRDCVTVTAAPSS